MWFRAEEVEEINWAGNPHAPVEPGASLGALNPRKSFEIWRETVSGRSRPWPPADLQSVRGFAPRAAFVLQQKRVRDLNQKLGAANERLAALASTDGLTGIPNRRAFDERLQMEWKRRSRPRRALAMIILDIDYFKQYNDHYGHLMGDDCLKEIARTLSEGRRAADLVARIGGEEFSLVMPETDAAGAMIVAEAVRARIEGLQLEHVKSPLGVVTASLGVAVAAGDSRKGPVEDLMLRADKALYEAKRSGRNRVALLEGD
jgi:diguanylate cyclase (GGDEF)-like protein